LREFEANFFYKLDQCCLNHRIVNVNSCKELRNNFDPDFKVDFFESLF
jgi:hypothetical protein